MNNPSYQEVRAVLDAALEQPIEQRALLWNDQAWSCAEAGLRFQQRQILARLDLPGKNS